MQNINALINGFLARLASDTHQELLTIIFAWKSVVGEDFYAHSRIVRYEKKTLFVSIANHVWAQEITLQRPVILEKLREKTKLEINKIIFLL